MKKSVKLVVLSFIAFLILLNTYGFVAETAQEKYYNYGHNIDEFLKESSSVQKQILNNPEFIKGVLESIKDSDKLKKLSEAWIKKGSDGKNILSDELKNKIWEKLDSTNAGKSLKQIVTTALQTKYGSTSISINDVKISDSGNLKWQGSKLGNFDKNGKLVNWIDVNNIPKYTTDIEYKNGEFSLKFKTAGAIKNILFKKGSIGANGEIIAPNGEKVGTNFAKGIQSIQYTDGKFILKFNLNGKERTLTLTQSDFTPEVFNNLKKILGDNNNVLSKAMEGQGLGANDKILQEVMSSLNGIGSDASKLSDNELNVLYGSNNNVETIEIDFDDKGKVLCSVSEGGTIVNIDSTGVPNRIYRQFNSAGGLGQGNANQKAEFVFDLSGEIKAAKNARITVSGFGDAYTTGNELVGVNIVRNTFVEAIKRGDRKAVIEAVLKDSNILKEVLQSQGSIDPKIKLIEMLKKELQSGEFKTAYKTELETALNTVLSNVEKSGNNLANYLLFGDKKELSPRENIIREQFLAQLSGTSNRALDDLLNNPDNLKLLLQGDKEKKNQFIQGFLQQRVDDSFVTTHLTTSLVTKISELAGVSSDQIKEQLKDKIKEIDVNSAIEDAFKEKSSSNSKEEFKENLNKFLTDKINSFIDIAVEAGNKKIEELNKKNKEKDGEKALILQPLDKEKIKSLLGNTVTATVDSIMVIGEEAEEKLSKEQADFIKNLKEGLVKTAETEYKSSLVIDTRMREVYASGSSYIAFDAQSPLTKFSASSNGAPIDLFSNGQLIARFDGANTYTSRIVGNNNYVPIESIENRLSPGRQLKLGVTSNGFSLYYPDQTVRKGNYVMPGLIVYKGPIFGIKWKIPFTATRSFIKGPTEGDIGSDPDARVKITNVAGEGKGFLFNWLMKKFSPNPSLKEMGIEIQKDIDEKFSKFLTDPGFADKLKQGEQALKFFAENNINNPDISALSDLLYVAKNKAEFNKITSFISKQTLPVGSSILFSNNFIEINGKRFTNANPAVFRTMMRFINEKPEVILSKEKIIDVNKMLSGK